MGVSRVELLDAIQKQVLSVLWLGALAWFCQLTEYKNKDIDKVTKLRLRVSYGDRDSWFENSLVITNVVKHTIELDQMTRQFTTKSAKHPAFVP